MKIYAIILTIMLSACGGGGSSDSGTNDAVSSAADMAGTWLGRATSTTFNGYVNIKLVLTQYGGNVTGNFVCTAGTLNCVHTNGYISGTVNGAVFNAILSYPDTHTCVAFNGGFSGSSLDASYTCGDPLANDSGTWHATR